MWLFLGRGVGGRGSLRREEPELLLLLVFRICGETGTNLGGACLPGTSLGLLTVVEHQEGCQMAELGRADAAADDGAGAFRLFSREEGRSDGAGCARHIGSCCQVGFGGQW